MYLLDRIHNMDTSITYITLTVYDSSLSSSILCPLLVSAPALSVVKYCISNKLTVNDFFLSFSNIIHCSLVYKLVSVVKYCISNKLTVNDFFLSFSNIIHCSLVYKLVSVVFTYFDSGRLLPLLAIATEMFQLTPTVLASTL